MPARYYFRVFAKNGLKEIVKSIRHFHLILPQYIFLLPPSSSIYHGTNKTISQCTIPVIQTLTEERIISRKVVSVSQT